MYKLTSFLLILVLILVVVAPILASIFQFEGSWVNEDHDSRGLSALEIRADRNQVTIHAWGECATGNCDWGNVIARAYGSKSQVELPLTAKALSAEFSIQGKNILLIVKPIGNELQVESFSTSLEGGNGTYAVYSFHRRNQLASSPYATSSSVIGTPRQISPLNGSIFSHNPRKTTLRWEAVAKAVSYNVEIDCFHCCKSGFWCSDIGRIYQLQTGLTDTKYTFNFVGPQPGRWRVWAVGSGGNESAKSGWWEFKYTQ